jgi:hypothetical protein
MGSVLIEGYSAMRRSKVIIIAMLLLPLAVTACGSSEETTDISEDQMNHYAGIAEHDHPTNSTSATPQSATPNPAKKQ